jgi:hypothetical protein
MLVLFETPAGYALFKLLDKAKIAKAEDVYRHFDTVEHAQQVVKLKAFSKFEDTTSALAAATSICDGKLDKSLKSFLKEAILKGKESADKVRTAAHATVRNTHARRDAVCTVRVAPCSSCVVSASLRVVVPFHSGDSRCGGCEVGWSDQGEVGY